MKRQVSLRLRSRLPLVWLAVLILGNLLLPSRIWTTLLVGLGGLFIVAYVWAWQLAQNLQGWRQLRFGWVAVGDRLSETFVIANHSPLPAFWVEVTDFSNVPGYRPGVVRSVSGGTVDRWRQEAICQRRGQFHLGPWSLYSSDPFGLFAITIQYPISDEIIIHPPVHTELPIPLPAGQSSGRTRARERSWQATLNAASVRDYQPNDPYRWIHWRTSARRDGLYVRQFDLDAAGDIWLLLDLNAGNQLGEGIDGTEEHAVLLAAALAARALDENRGVGLATYGREPQLIAPGHGEGQQWRLLRALALVKADGESELELGLRDLSRVARRGSAAVIITPSASSDWLPALLLLSQAGIQNNVILLERGSFGGTGSSAGLRDAIRQFGATCHLVRQGEVGQRPEPEKKHGFWEFRTLATGKVIVTERPDGSPAR